MGVALAPLGDSLLWIASFYMSPRRWSVYDPSGTFGPGSPVFPSVRASSIIEELTHLEPGRTYFFNLSRDVFFMGRPLFEGVSMLSWPSEPIQAVAPADGVPVADALEPLAGNVLWVAGWDESGSVLQVYDPIGSFTLDQFGNFEFPPQVASLTHLVPGSTYGISLSEDVLFQKRCLRAGLNRIVWPGATPETGSLVSNLPWYCDRLMSHEKLAVEGIQHVVDEHPAIAPALVSLPWVTDGMDGFLGVEHRVLYSLRNIPAGSSLLRGLMEFPWFTDGITRSEASFVGSIASINTEYSSQAELIMGFPNVADGITPAEGDFVGGLNSLRIQTSDKGYLVPRILAVPWVADGLTGAELRLFQTFFRFARDEAVDVELANSVFESPMFDVSDGHVDMLQAEAAELLYDALFHDWLDTLLDEPRFQDGLTDEELALFAVLRYNEYEPLFQDMMRYGEVHSRTITLPLTGEMKLFIISGLPDHRDDEVQPSTSIVVQPGDGLGHAASHNEIFDYMRSSMAHIESAVGVPWWKNFAIFVIDPNHHMKNFGASGLNADSFMIMIHPGALEEIVPHELAHDYFNSPQLPLWLAEGTASFLERDPFSRPDEHHQSRYNRLKGGCATKFGQFENINDHAMAWARNTAIQTKAILFPDDFCEYTIGEAFWLGMYLSLGQELVSTYLAELSMAGEAVYAERISGLKEGEIYQVMLSNTPPGKRAQFRDLWRELYGRDMEAEHSGDRAALVAVAEAHEDLPAVRNPFDNWLTDDAPISQWHRVVTNDSGRVISLDLSNIQIRSIPPELGSLTMLEELYLTSTSQLGGTIPAELGDLSNLEYLYLGDRHKLTGCIPQGLRRVLHNDFHKVGLPFC